MGTGDEKLMKNIGIIGQGFVGTAIRDGLVHAFGVVTYDKKYSDPAVRVWQKKQTVVHYEEDVEFYSCPTKDQNPIKKMVEDVDGPIFVAVPTPMKKDSTCDLSIVESVVSELDGLGESIGKKIVVVIKSTVVPGTTEAFNEKYKNVYVCYNPEFLVERTALEDFKSQDRIIVGGPRKATKVIKQLYATAYPNVPVTKTSSTIAELVKYTTNCFLATKVSFANEIKQVCDSLDVDYDKVVEYAIKDKRLGGSHWSVPGPDGLLGFGGSCFPKDLNALLSKAFKLNVKCNTIYGAWLTNLEVRPEKDWENLIGRAVSERD